MYSHDVCKAFLEMLLSEIIFILDQQMLKNITKEKMLMLVILHRLYIS